jgi:hypothetical protein
MLMSQPHFGLSVRMRLTLPKVGTWESSGTPKNSELDCRGQNTSHLDICRPSYGQKKGQESNWQFDSRPLKVQIRPLLDVCKRNARWHWKYLKESYNFGLDLTPIRGRSQEMWIPKVPGVQPGKKCHWMWLLRSNAKNTIWGKVVASPEFGMWWVKWVQGRPWLVPTPKGCRMNSNQLVVGFGCKTV